jgi:phage shock protein A
MGIFKRFKDIASANINDLLDKAEEPEKMLEEYLRQREDDIRELEKAYATQITAERQLETQTKAYQAEVDKRQAQAEKALSENREDLARRALESKKEQKALLDAITPAYEKAKADTQKLREQVTEVKRDYETAKNQKTALIARAQAAKATKAVNQAMSGIGGNTGTKGFSRMEQKVMQMEAEAEAAGEMRSGDKSLDEEIESLGGSSEVDDELAALKAKMGKE